MSTKRQADSSQKSTSEPVSLLDSITSRMPKAIEKDEAQDLVANVIQRATQGTVVWDKTVTRTIRAAISKLDEQLSLQLAEIMHQEAFQKLEGSWRGLHHLVSNTTTNKELKLKLLNVGKQELYKDLDDAIEFDQSVFWKKIYETEFGTAGGEPFGAIVGDYEFSKHPEDIELLTKISGVCAGAHCPFISAADPKLFDLESWTELSEPRDIEKIFMGKKHIAWNAFRDTEDSRYVTLVLPRVLARLPYGRNTKKTEEFAYEEFEVDASGDAGQTDHGKYCWMNASYVLGANLTNAFHETGWCTRIRGVKNGGKVEGLPVHNFISDDGDFDTKCPTEIAITDRREAELSKEGFLPLCHFKNTDYSVFFGGQTCQRPKKYTQDDATANAAISARLPYMMAVSRVAHFLKCIARDEIGSFKERKDMEDFLKRWISEYVALGDPDDTVKAEKPFAEAEVTVEEVPGSPGSYRAVALLRPWLQMEELTTSLRLVAKLPKKV